MSHVECTAEDEIQRLQIQRLLLNDQRVAGTAKTVSTWRGPVTTDMN